MTKLTYEDAGLSLPALATGLSVRGTAASWAALKGVSLVNIVVESFLLTLGQAWSWLAGLLESNIPPASLESLCLGERERAARGQTVETRDKRHSSGAWPHAVYYARQKREEKEKKCFFLSHLPP
ncbi:hypothetical protein SRHO_G00160910 [Serrasalmus rhombeus]